MINPSVRTTTSDTFCFGQSLTLTKNNLECSLTFRIVALENSTLHNRVCIHWLTVLISIRPKQYLEDENRYCK